MTDVCDMIFGNTHLQSRPSFIRFGGIPNPRPSCFQDGIVQKQVGINRVIKGMRIGK
jgi:hypothetical protein